MLRSTVALTLSLLLPAASAAAVAPQEPVNPFIVPETVVAGESFDITLEAVKGMSGDLEVPDSFTVTGVVAGSFDVQVPVGDSWCDIGSGDCSPEGADIIRFEPGEGDGKIPLIITATVVEDPTESTVGLRITDEDETVAEAEVVVSEPEQTVAATPESTIDSATVREPTVAEDEDPVVVEEPDVDPTVATTSEPDPASTSAPDETAAATPKPSKTPAPAPSRRNSTPAPSGNMTVHSNYSAMELDPNAVVPPVAAIVTASRGNNGNANIRFGDTALQDLGLPIQGAPAIAFRGLTLHYVAQGTDGFLHHATFDQNHNFSGFHTVTTAPFHSPSMVVAGNRVYVGALDSNNHGTSFSFTSNSPSNLAPTNLGGTFTSFSVFHRGNNKIGWAGTGGSYSSAFNPGGSANSYEKWHPDAAWDKTHFACVGDLAVAGNHSSERVQFCQEEDLGGGFGTFVIETSTPSWVQHNTISGVALGTPGATHVFGDVFALSVTGVTDHKERWRPVNIEYTLTAGWQHFSDPASANAAGTRVAYDPRWTATVKGTVYTDWDNDGTRDAGEPAVSGMEMSAGSRRTETDSDGNYTLRYVREGNVTVEATGFDPNVYSGVTQAHQLVGMNVGTTSSQFAVGRTGTVTGIDFGLSGKPEWVEHETVVMPNPAEIGDHVFVRGWYKNTGNTTLRLTFDVQGCPDFDTTPLTVKPGETTPHIECGGIISESTPNGTLTYALTTTATDGNPSTADLTHTVSGETLVSNGPGVSINKTADVPEGVTLLHGQQVTWSYAVRNTGALTLNNLEVTDDKQGTICTISVLQPGESHTCTKTGAP